MWTCPNFVGVSVSCPKRKKRAKRAKFLNFFVFGCHFCFFRLFVSLFTKKRKFFFYSSKKKISTSFVCFARLWIYTHIKDHHHGKFCDDDDRKDDDAIVVLCILFVFVAFISLSLSLFFLAWLKIFFTNRERESTDFFFASSPSIFKMWCLLCVCLCRARKIKRTSDWLRLCLCVLYTDPKTFSLY